MMPTRAASHRQLVAAAKALGHPARLRILAMLRPGSLCVCQMSAVLQLAASTVSGHLNELRRAGLVVENKVGKLVYYRLDEGSPFAPWLAQALDLVEDDQRGREDGLLARKVQGVPIPLLTQGGLTLEDLRRRRARPGPAAAAART